MQISTALHIYGDGTTIPMIRLIADEGKSLTKDGIDLWNCVEVTSADGWYEVDAPIEEFQEL